jgi:hypothetical protein
VTDSNKNTSERIREEEDVGRSPGCLRPPHAPVGRAMGLHGDGNGQGGSGREAMLAGGAVRQRGLGAVLLRPPFPDSSKA